MRATRSARVVTFLKLFFVRKEESGARQKVKGPTAAAAAALIFWSVGARLLLVRGGGQ